MQCWDTKAADCILVVFEVPARMIINENPWNGRTSCSPCKHQPANVANREFTEVVKKQTLVRPVVSKQILVSVIATYLWNAIPISVRKTSRFFPLKFWFAVSLIFSRNSQHSIHGSVFTLENAISSLRGLKSFFFCFVNAKVSQLMIADVNKK